MSSAAADLHADPGRYFPPPDDGLTFAGNSEWRPVADGRAYFAELDRCLSAAGPGDSVFVAGLEVQPDLDLAGRPGGAAAHAPAGAAGRAPLGARLAALAARGADVRVLVAGRVLAASLPGASLPFRGNALSAERLRGLCVEGHAGAPLAGRVLLDYSGALLGSNHQKYVIAHLGGDLVAYVSGIDLVDGRDDATPHHSMRLRGRRWGWHDIAVRLRGAAAREVWEIFRQRWAETLTLPPHTWFPRPGARRPLNPPGALPPPGPAPQPPAVAAPGVAVRVLRSTYRHKVDSVLPSRRRGWQGVPAGGQQQVYATLVTAISAARRYVYVEDQYLGEALGGSARYELYPFLRAAAARGVKVVLVGSGVRDPDDPFIGRLPINRVLNRDLRTKLIAPLSPEHRANVAVARIEHCTVHAKLTIIDDVFANIGSANMFSRSMIGTDSELSAAVVTTTGLVRDLRVAVWADHLRTPVTPALYDALADLDLALGVWRPEWLPGAAPGATWRSAGVPSGFAPAERVIAVLGGTPAARARRPRPRAR